MFYQDLVAPKKSPIFGHSYSTRNILTRLEHPRKSMTKSTARSKVDDKATNTVKIDTFEPLTSTERLSTVSSPYMVIDSIKSASFWKY